MSSAGGRTRREILTDAAKAAAAASVAGIAGCFPAVGGHWPDASVPPDTAARGPCARPGPPAPVSPAVVEVFREDSVVVGAKFVIQPDVVANMLDAGLMALARQALLFNAGSSAPDNGAGAGDADPSGTGGETDTADAGQPGPVVDNPWKVLLPNYQPCQRIGLKVNCLSGKVPTSPAVVRAIIASLRDKFGVDPKNIVVWDRRLDELNGAGKYSADDLAGAQLLGTLVAYGKVTAGEPGYGDPIDPGVEGLSPRLSKILTEQTDLTINCPVLKNHGVSGVTAALKNIYGVIDIPGQYHKNFSTAMPKLYALPAIRNSLCLTIVDALVSLANGDADSVPDSAPKRILLAQDPVALDSYALVLTNQLRALLPRAVPPIDSGLTTWLENSATLGLGTTNYSLIKA